MNMHQHARLTPKGREHLVKRLERGEHPRDLAGALGARVRTVYKWRQRCRQFGLAGLQDQSSRPHTSPVRTSAELETRVIALRRERRIYDLIAIETGLSRSTLARILVRHGPTRRIP